nr:porin family protein [uncultured Draconibacterium sp.]
MKKTLFLVLLTFILFQGHAQNSGFGFGAGVNYTNLALNNVPDGNTGFKVGMQFNAIFKTQLKDQLWLRLEPGFAQRGTELGYSIYQDTRINLSYLVLPVAFEFSPVDKFTILLGPEGSYRLAAKAKADGSTSDVKSIYDSKIDLGIIAGVSYQFIDNLALELRYNRGLISTIKDLTLTDEQGNSEGKARLYNQGITFLVVYTLNRK